MLKTNATNKTKMQNAEMADATEDESKPKLNRKGGVSKKRAKNVEEWHKTKQRRLRIAGKEYVNAKGKVVPAKKPGPDCQCRRKCYKRVPQSERLKTFNGFYALKSYDEQNAYLFGLMRQIDVKRKRVKECSRRTCTFEYYVRVKGIETQVCQTAFKNIHAITERKVRVLCKKMDDGIMFPCDNRGKNSHQRAGEVRLPQQTIEQIKLHIYSIVHTHRLKDYIRLDKVAGLDINVTKMWKDYIKTYDPEHYEYTIPKTKREREADTMDDSQSSTQEQTYQGINYTNTSLVNVTENYFTQQTYPVTQVQVSSAGFYHPPLLLQSHPSSQNHTNPPYLFVPTKCEPEPVHNLCTKVTTKKRRASKGPEVKQWRYTNMFHELINGAVLAAIKTRLGMYYSEKEAKKKQKKCENVEVQTPPQLIQNVHNVATTADGHTLTIYT